MTKSITLALVAVAGTLIFTGNAHARCHRRARCCAPVASCCAPVANCCASSCNACSASVTIDQSTPVATSVNSSTNVAANNGSSYQSFSYEPGSTTNGTTTNVTTVAPAAPVMIYQAPMTNRTYRSEFDSVLRGDRKVRGL